MELKCNDEGEPFVMWGDNCIKVEKEKIEYEEYYKNKAEKELRETKEQAEQSLKELRKLLKYDTDLFIPVNDDGFLLKFLRPCKFYVNSAYQKIKSFYKFKETYPDYSRDLVPSSVRLVFESSVVSFLGPRDQHGRRVIILEIGEKWNYREISPIDLFRAYQVALDIAMMEPRTQVSGVVTVCDVKGMSIKQIFQFAPGYAKNCLDWMQDCAPVRFRAFHSINQPYIFNVFYAIFKPFINEKLRNRIFFHGTNLRGLLEHVDGKALRQRHGGTLPEPEISGDITAQIFDHYEEEFKVANSYGYKKKVNH